MTRHCRIGVAVGLASLVTCLATATPASAQNTKFFPAETEIVLTVNLRNILQSDLLQGKKDELAMAKAIGEAALGQNADAEKYVKALGFDPFKDLDSVTAVMPRSSDLAKGLAILHGKFDGAKLKATAAQAAKDHGDVIQLTKAGVHQIIEITPPGENKVIYIALANPTTLLVAHGRATLTTALAQGSGEKKAELKKEVQDLLESRDAKSSISFVATSGALDELSKGQNVPPQLQALPIAQILSTIDGFNGSITVGKNIDFQMGVGTKDVATAKKYAQDASVLLLVARGLVANQAKQNPQLAPLVDVVKTVRTSTQGSTFIIRGQVAAAVLEEALKSIPR